MKNKHEFFGNGGTENGGFTLIELLVVISIIGLLSSIILASLSTARSKGINAHIQEDVISLRNQIELGWDGSAYADLADNFGPPAVATNATMSPSIANIASDILKQLNFTLGSNYDGGATGSTVNCGGSLGSLPNFNGGSYTTTDGMVIYGDIQCGLATKYAIYAAYGPTVGSSGYYCRDSSGGIVSKSSGFIPYAFPTTPSYICQ